MNLQVVAVDAGKYNSKGKSNRGTCLFRTKYSMGYSDPNTLGENNFNVIYEGKEYTIGEQGTESDKNEGKESLIHKMATLVALSKLAEDDKDIILIYGESFNKYANEDHRKQLEKMYLGEHKILINEEEYKFNIKEVHILPEGIGHILQDIVNNLGVQYVADWGGTTFNFLKVVNGAPDKSLSTSFKLGMHNMISILRSKIAKEGIGDFEEDLIQNWIDTKAPKNEIQKIIDDTIEEQFLKIENRLAPLGINLAELPKITFVGGTSEMFKSIITKKYEGAEVHRNCLFATVEGLYEFGRLKYLP